MLEKLGYALVGTAVSIVLIPIAIALTAVVLWVASLPFRLFKATRAPQIAVGIPALIFAVTTLWYGEVGFFRVLLQYGVASAAVVAFWDYRDDKKNRRERERAAGTAASVAADVFPRPMAGEAKALPSVPQSDSDIVKACLSEVDKAEAALNAKILGLPSSLMQEVRRQISDGTGRTVYTVRVSGVSPHNVAWLVISNVAGELVACGEHHVYRGVLGISGQALQQAFVHAVHELQRGGRHDAAAVAKDLEWLHERIREAG
jgi:hypothetical protein